MKEEFVRNSLVVLSVLLSAFVLNGCASTPIATDLASVVPTSRILDNSFLVQKPHTGEVIVKRDSTWQCPGVSIKIFVDSLPVAELRSEEKVIMYLPEGEHILGARPNGICAGGFMEANANVKAERRLVFRTGFGTNSEFIFAPTAF